jgi:hypothetical protein
MAATVDYQLAIDGTPGTFWFYREPQQTWIMSMALRNGNWLRIRCADKAEAWQVAVDKGMKPA